MQQGRWDHVRRHGREDQRGGRRSWGAAAGFSAALHIIVAVALLWPHPSPQTRPPPTIEVELISPPEARPTASGPNATRPRRTRSNPAPALAPSALVTPAPPVEPLPAVTPLIAPPVATSAAPNLQRALRGALGCDHADLVNLSLAEKQACREQAARRLEPHPGQPSFGMDPRKRAAFAAEAKEREPFLIQTPKNGCKPRVAQKDVGNGATHDWTAGISCAKSF